jgi:hypothetical protein
MPVQYHKRTFVLVAQFQVGTNMIIEEYIISPLVHLGYNLLIEELGLALHVTASNFFLLLIR